MIAVADASPVCYLVLIGEIELLSKLFAQVLLPREVLDELLVEGAPPMVRAWADSPPLWILIRDGPAGAEKGMERLQAGERAAILLAESVHADVIVLDEKSARRIAAERGLRVTGLLGVLVEATNRGLVDLAAALERLTKTSFRYSPALLKSALERQNR
jgi:predicted nucleic acid-binding protein